MDSNEPNNPITRGEYPFRNPLTPARTNQYGSPTFSLLMISKEASGILPNAFQGNVKGESNHLGILEENHVNVSLH